MRARILEKRQVGCNAFPRGMQARTSFYQTIRTHASARWPSFRRFARVFSLLVVGKISEKWATWRIEWGYTGCYLVGEGHNLLFLNGRG